MAKRLRLSLHREEWATDIPFRITGLTRNAFKMIVVEISDGQHTGRGEGLPVHYLKETIDSLCQQIEATAGEIERGVGRETLLDAMPPGAARKAVDTALWDLEAKRLSKSIWELTGIRPKPVLTALTIGIEDTPETMAARAVSAAAFPMLKIKLDRDRPVERVAAIRSARPTARLLVDANQGWTFEQLLEVTPELARLGVEVIEQPLPRGADELLEAYRSPIPLCADESCQHRGELEQAARRYQIINIKLDKAGGLTEALALERQIRARGLTPWVGNMGGTSLSMAPAFALAQLCPYVELDGPLLLKYDRPYGLVCRNGMIDTIDRRLWG